MKFNYRDQSVVIAGFTGEYMLTILKKIGTFYELELLEHIARLNRQGVFVDVGANIGNHTIYFAKFCPGADSVLAFEPVTDTYKQLKKNIVANKLQDRVQAYELALGASRGKVTMAEGPKGNVTGMAKVVDTPGSVEMAVLDDYVEQRIAVIKIDVEGFEPDVLKGSTEVIRRYKPDIFIEAQDQAAKDKLDAIMQPLGYRDVAVFCATPTYHYQYQTLRRKPF